MVMCYHGDKIWCLYSHIQQKYGTAQCVVSLIHPHPLSLPLLPSISSLSHPQVIDLSETPPEGGLEICRLLSQHSCRVLVCGGDGTVGWVLTTIDKCKLPVSYTVAIVTSWVVS